MDMYSKNFYKFYFFILFGGINLFIFLFFYTGNLSTLFSFFVNFLLVFYLLTYSAFKKDFKIPLINVSIFFYIFFVLSPYMQIYLSRSSQRLPNQFIYNDELILIANLFIFLFLLTFFLFYRISSKIFKYKSVSVFLNKKEYSFNLALKLTIFILIILLIITLYLFFKFVSIQEILEFNLRLLKKTDEELSSLLIIFTKLFFSFSLVIFSLIFLFKKELKKTTFIILLFISFIFLILTKNPFLEKRNAIGTVYLTILFILLPEKYKNNFFYTVTIFFIIFIIFPISSLFTHSTYGISYLFMNLNMFINETIQKRNVFNFLEEINSLDFDAWSNFLATIEFVHRYDYSYLLQTLGSFFFLIPRSLFPDKPLSGGQLIGNYLIDNYGLWFSNLSHPFIAEAYLNMGIFGIFIYAIILGILVKYIEYKYYTNNIFLKIWIIYFSFYIIFLLRGSFYNAIGYLELNFLGIFLLPFFIYKIITLIICKKK